MHDLKPRMRLTREDRWNRLTRLNRAIVDAKLTVPSLRKAGYHGAAGHLLDTLVAMSDELKDVEDAIVED